MPRYKVSLCFAQYKEIEVIAADPKAALRLARYCLEGNLGAWSSTSDSLQPRREGDMDIVEEIKEG